MATKPALCLIPSGIKQNKVYSVLPSNGDGDFTFSRSGNATRVNKDGFIEEVGSGIPRLNYPLIDGEVSGCPSLLLEPERRNLITYSEDLTATGWNSAQGGTGISPIRTANYGIAPNGNQTATRVQFDLNGGTSSSDISYIAYYYAATGVATTNSIYMKSLSGTADVRMRCGGTFKEVDVTTEWQRFDITDGATSDRVQILLYGHLSSQSADLLIWGAQAEQGSYPTSYIPTNGEANGVTRSAETCNNAGNSNVFNSEEGVLYFEGSSIYDSGLSRRISISDGSITNRVAIEFDETTENRLRAFISNRTIDFDGGVLSSYNKIAVVYKNNERKLYFNGFLVGVNTDVFSMNGINSLQFQGGSNSNSFYGNTKDLRTYNTALTDAELEKLTSYDSFRDMAIAGQYKTY